MNSLIELLKKGMPGWRSFSSNSYWNDRYRNGGNSGPGSYGHLAKFKADVLNRFVKETAASSLIEFGCGDGNQLKLAEYPKYVGYDISPTAISGCKKLFANDATKEFFQLTEYDGRKADISMSLDVIFHLIEDEIFDSYMHRLFSASKKYVAVYSSNTDESIQPSSSHVRHRRFTSWIEGEPSVFPHWHLIEKVPNPYPFDGNSNKTSFSDFFFYERK